MAAHGGWVIVAILVCAGAAAQVRPAERYVSPDGDDAWSGTLPEPNAGRTDGPFATLARARDAVRQARAEGGLTGEATVEVREGAYCLPETLRLGPEDSGTTFRAYPGEHPTLIGGRAVSGFVAHEGPVLKADVNAQGLAGANFRQLIYRGERQPLARYPNYDPENPYGGGWAYADGQIIPMYQEVEGESRRTLQYKAEDAREWAHPEEGEVFTFPRYNWWNNLVPVASIDRDARLITLTGDCSYPIRPGDRYYVQGLLEELDAPGEWYLDRRTGTLYFQPPGPTDGEVVAYVPTMRTLVEIGPGTQRVTLQGFTLECCEGTAVTLRETEDCLIAGNTIRNVGDYHGSGVSVDGGRRNGVVGNDIHHVGHSGVSLSGGDRIALSSAENYADNNYIHHVGVYYKQGVGVALTGCGNRASHNLIHDGPRFGILFSGNNLVIEYNHIRHVNLETADTGAVYTGGRDWLGSRGTVIRHNYFHDIIGFGNENGRWVSPHYCWGVYLDDNTGGVDVIGNIVARCVRGLVHLHNGRDNLIENNILIDGTLQQVEYNGWTRDHPYWSSHLPTMIEGWESVKDQPAWKQMRNMDLDPREAVLPNGMIMTGNVFRRNIMVYRDPNAKLFRFSNVPWEGYESDYNLAYHYGAPILTGATTVKETTGPNLAPNPGFEEGEPGALPAGWRWGVKPNDSAAALDPAHHVSGGLSLRIDGRGTTTDASGQRLVVNFNSEDIPLQPGKTYRLSASFRADEPTSCAIMAQSYEPNQWFWARPKGLTADEEWQQVETVFRFPTEGDPDYHEGMQTVCLRIDVSQGTGTIWVDDVDLREAVVLSEWEAWQALGFDQHSEIADPRFVDLEHEDYRLQPDSPALKLGFQPIPVEQIGPYESPLRASWPIVEAEGAREKPARLETGER
jgi:hypothetical protein